MKNNNIEVEIKFILQTDLAERIEKSVAILPGVIFGGRKYEKSIMFDNAEKRMNNEDARLRVRQIGEGMDGSKIEFTYKRRLKADGPIKKEEEIEVVMETNPHLFITILNKMGYEKTTSYERYRSTYIYNGLKITFDEFPFGHILEIEGEEEVIKNECAELGLNVADSTLESCDDIYDRLCRENGVRALNHIEFSDVSMPHAG